MIGHGAAAGYERMRVARVKSILWLTSALAFAAAVMVILAAAMLPFDSSSDAPAQATSHPKFTAPATQPLFIQPLASFEPAWRVSLRRPLVEPPASTLPAADAAAKPVELAVRLIGTIVDGQHPRGVFMTGLTKVELKSVGEKVGNAEVLAIDDNSATLSYEGRTITLHREKKPFDPSGESYEAKAAAN